MQLLANASVHCLKKYNHKQYITLITKNFPLLLFLYLNLKKHLVQRELLELSCNY